MDKQRKFLLVLPLLVIPFMTLAFWALGGGKNDRAQMINTQGLDASLPEAQFKKNSKNNKMAVYQQAVRDSVHDGISPSFLKSMGMDKKSPDSVVTADDQAQRIQTKLAQLNKQINQPQPTNYEEPEPQQVRQLRKMMKGMNSEPDPEMKQLNQMLDKYKPYKIRVQLPLNQKKRKKIYPSKQFQL